MPSSSISITFSVLNERFGRAYGDDVLRRLADKIRELIHDSGGIVTRSGADVFEVYCPHRDDYKSMLDKLTQHVSDDRNKSQPISICMGVYANVDKSISIEGRLNRARMAAETVRGSKTRPRLLAPKRSCSGSIPSWGC